MQDSIREGTICMVNHDFCDPVIDCLRSALSLQFSFILVGAIQERRHRPRTTAIQKGLLDITNVRIN